MQKSTLLTLMTAAVAVFATIASLAQEATVAPKLQNFTATGTCSEVLEELRRVEGEEPVVRYEGDTQRIAEQGFRSTKTSG